jgi:two-component system response regulator NreC
VKRVRTLVADDHTIFREGLVALLERDPGLEVVAQAATGGDALAAIEATGPDVALLDVGMPGMTGIEVARKLRDAGARTSVVLLSAHHEAAFVRDALLAGASGYVTKDATTRELVDAVHAAAGGGLYLSGRVAAAGVAGLMTPAADPTLTPRERDVVRLLARGLTSKEIATELRITAKTVDGFRAAIMDKLGIHHVAGLVKWALRHHLATPDD